MTAVSDDFDDWFPKRNAAILDAAGSLTTATGPRDLEQATAELVGGELHQAIHGETGGLILDLWLRSLIIDARIRLVEGGPDEGIRYLLHGVTAIGPPDAVKEARLALKRTRWASSGPTWLGGMAKPKAGRDVRRLEDRYGTRLGIVMEYAFPGGSPMAYLFDVDASGIPLLVDSGVHDDAARAADAWRAAAGDTATDAPLEAVTSSGELRALAQLDLQTPFGDETRSRADDWYRAQRRVQDLAAALRSTAHPLPPQRSFFDEDTTPLVEEFSEWHVARHGHAPDEELTGILAGEWQEGILPQTTYCVSPQRIEYQLSIIGDTFEPETVAELRNLIRIWSRWLGERDGLPEDLLARIDRATRTRPAQPGNA